MAWLAWYTPLVSGILPLYCVYRSGHTAASVSVATDVANTRQTVTNLSSRNIEDLRPGDLVLSRDPLTGELGRKPVVQTFTRVSDHLRLLTVLSPRGEQQTIKTTDEHPFFLVEGDQLAAADLEPGDELSTPDGQPAILVATHREEHPAGVTVYNFEVADHHTYHVAAHGARGPPLLVHNSSGDCAAGLKPGRQSSANNAPVRVVDYSGELTRNTSNATRTLRNNLNTNSATHRPHHIIPLQTSEHPVVQAAARGGFNINGANNGINLELRVHPQGARHPRYNAAVQQQLDNLAARNLSDAQAAAEVQAIADRLRPGLDRLNQSGQPLR